MQRAQIPSSPTPRQLPLGPEQAVQSLEPFVPPRLDGPQFLVTLPLLINFPAVPLAAFECPGELKGWA